MTKRERARLQKAILSNEKHMASIRDAYMRLTNRSDPQKLHRTSLNTMFRVLKGQNKAFTEMLGA
jgi:rRNA pseudouridine-1189 N-methylase Emg1 (Nep1/Mra1 family)